jgi:hypothetical protein
VQSEQKTNLILAFSALFFLSTATSTISSAVNPSNFNLYTVTSSGPTPFKVLLLTGNRSNLADTSFFFSF